MKAVFFYAFLISIALSFTATVSPVYAQQKDSSTQQLSNRIDARKFIFKAQTATPQTGSFIQLNYLYDITISGDSIISYLPYYGRAFVAPMNIQDAGLEFTATDFIYDVEKQKDDEWLVTIETKGLRDNYKLLFTIYNNGQAQLQVSSNNRLPIRFDGYVVEKGFK